MSFPDLRAEWEAQDIPSGGPPAHRCAEPGTTALPHDAPHCAPSTKRGDGSHRRSRPMAITTSLSRQSPHALSRRASASLAWASAAALFAISVSVGTAAAQGTDGTWGSPFDHPESRRNHNAVYDPLHARMIVFGGTSSTFETIWTLSLGDR